MEDISLIIGLLCGLIIDGIATWLFVKVEKNFMHQLTEDECTTN